jgi:hypothetical protein
MGIILLRHPARAIFFLADGFRAHVTSAVEAGWTDAGAKSTATRSVPIANGSEPN